MVISYDYIQLYDGKEGSFLDHETLAPLLDQYAQAQFTQDWKDLNFKDSDNTFAQELEENVLEDSFTSYWATAAIGAPAVLYIKTVDATITVEKIGYQFTISDDEPFAVTTTNKGFPILEYTKE